MLLKSVAKVRIVFSNPRAFVMIELSSCPEWQDILVVSVIIFIYLLF